MSPPSREVTVRQIGLVPSTAKIVHPYLSGSLSKVSTRPYMCCSTIAQLPADDVAVVYVPEIVTDSAPLAAVVDLNTTLVGVSTPNKSYGEI
jgi:hypothetical protein